MQLPALLSILEANRDWWMTYSDLAIWMYGDDSEDDIRAIRMIVYRLRGQGHRFLTHRVGWPSLDRQYITTIKLSDETVSRERKAA